MANTKQFTDLPAVTSLADGDILPIQTVAGETSKITKANLKATLGDQGITAVVEDTTPKLGGDLDADNKDITNLGTVNTHTIPAGTGTIALTSDIPDVSPFITDISGQDLSTADNTTSAFITAGDVPAVPTALSELTNDLTEINGITITEGAGTLTLNDNTLSVTGADVIINASDEATITFPDTTGTILIDDDTTVTIPNATTITSTANGDVYTLPTSTGTLALTDDIPTDLSDLTDNTSLIPDDISDLTDTTGVIPTNTNELTNGAGFIAEVVTDTSPQLGGDLDLNQFNVKLITAPSSDHKVSGTIIALTANENQAFGDVCFINADGEAQLIDADTITTMSAVVMCADASISGNASGNYLLMGIARDDSWAWTVGGLIYGTITGTSGTTLSQTAPLGENDVVQIMGVATHANRMLFKPQLVQIEHA